MVLPQCILWQRELIMWEICLVWMTLRKSIEYCTSSTFNTNFDASWKTNLEMSRSFHYGHFSIFHQLTIFWKSPLRASRKTAADRKNEEKNSEQRPWRQGHGCRSGHCWSQLPAAVAKVRVSTPHSAQSVLVLANWELDGKCKKNPTKAYKRLNSEVP